ncbi:hypothetical protein ACLOJK_024493 [Asimina triloba]
MASSSPHDATASRPVRQRPPPPRSATTRTASDAHSRSSRSSDASSVRKPHAPWPTDEQQEHAQTPCRPVRVLADAHVPASDQRPAAAHHQHLLRPANPSPIHLLQTDTAPFARARSDASLQPPFDAHEHHAHHVGHPRANHPMPAPFHPTESYPFTAHPHDDESLIIIKIIYKWRDLGIRPDTKRYRRGEQGGGRQGEGHHGQARDWPFIIPALLNWAVESMADVVEEEEDNKMNARNIAMVFAPNMTRMVDPSIALMHVVQVMNLLKTLILKTLREREEAATGGSSPFSSTTSDQQIDDFDNEEAEDMSCESREPTSDDDQVSYSHSNEENDHASLDDIECFLRQLDEGTEDVGNDRLQRPPNAAVEAS